MASTALDSMLAPSFTQLSCLSDARYHFHYSFAFVIPFVPFDIIISSPHDSFLFHSLAHMTYLLLRPHFLQPLRGKFCNLLSVLMFPFHVLFQDQGDKSMHRTPSFQFTML